METVVERELGQRLDVGDGDARMASDQRRPQRLLGVVEERAPLRPSVTEFYRVFSVAETKTNATKYCDKRNVE